MIQGKMLRISTDLSLPPDVVTSTSVVFGGKGMGKTNLGSVIVEELTKARLRWSFLDPMGVSFGLRHSKDGKGPGVECVILGGIHGDIPIEPTSGEIVADLVVDEPVNTIIDFSRNAAGVPWSKGEKIKFVTAYVNRLFRRQGEMVGADRKERREPLLQIVDEAARYIPQVIPHGSPELAACVGAWEQAAEEGRNIGLGVCFLTQRSARINKSVSELADVMFAFRTVGPNSVDAIVDWLGDHFEKPRARELAGKIRELDVGQCLVVSPGWLKISDRVVKIRERETFDSSATPKPGERARSVSGEAAKPDLGKYRARMAETIERAKADDPKELRKEIAALKKQAASASAAPAKEKIVERTVVDERVVKRAIADALKPFQWKDAQLQRSIASSAAALRQFVDAFESLARVGAATVEIGAGLTPPPRPTPQRPEVAAPRPRPTGGTPVQRAPVDGVSKGQQKILNALAELEVLGVSSPSRYQLGMVAGYNLTGGTGAQHVADLGKLGLLEVGDGVVSITDAGRAAANVDDVPTTLAELHERVLRKLNAGQRKIAEHLIAIYPDAISRVELGEATDYNLTGGSGAQHVADLVTVGAAEIPSKGSVRASSLLFPEGLA